MDSYLLPACACIEQISGSLSLVSSLYHPVKVFQVQSETSVLIIEILADPIRWGQAAMVLLWVFTYDFTVGVSVMVIVLIVQAHSAAASHSPMRL